MPRYDENDGRGSSDAAVGFSIAGFGFFAVVGIVGLGLWGCPRYNVYEQEMDGQAQLQKAESTRRFKVLEAQAEYDSSILKAKAEVERSKGLAQANEILAKGLGGPENYLRWKFIEAISSNGDHGIKQIIYLPTEVGIPIMEASRLQNKTSPLEVIEKKK